MEVGIDIVKNRRVKLDPKFLKHVLSPKELALLTTMTNKKRVQEFVAGRWAVKEAILKTLDQPIPMNKIEVLNEASGKPYVNLLGEVKTYKIKISLSHERRYSVGVAINESDS